VTPRGISTGSWESERDDWTAAVARARREGWVYLELCAIVLPLVESLAAYLPGELDGFERVSIHGPLRVAPAVGVGAVAALPVDHDVVLHPDVYGTEQSVEQLGRRAVFENMDVAKDFGRTAVDLAEVFERFPEAGFCLDVAHVKTVDPSLALGHELLDAFGDRLRQLHVSGIEPDGTHRTTTRADLELYAPLLARCRGIPWLLEAVLEDA
jgi:hypothetical protein